MLRNEEANHPNRNSDIYATIAIKEIKEGLTPEDFKNMDKAKARQYKQQLDELYGGEDVPMKDLPTTFFGMTDDEIIVNKGLFQQVGLL